MKTLSNVLVWLGILIVMIWFFSNCFGPPTQYESQSRGQDSENLPGDGWIIKVERPVDPGGLNITDGANTLNAIQIDSFYGDGASGQENAIYVDEGWDCILAWKSDSNNDLCLNRAGEIYEIINE